MCYYLFLHHLIRESWVLQGVLRDLSKVSAGGGQDPTVKAIEQVCAFTGFLILIGMYVGWYFFCLHYCFLMSHEYMLQSEGEANDSDVINSAADIFNLLNGDNWAVTVER